MIDFHSHILPNIDDGSKSVGETFHLIEEAKQAGFNEIISTSHYMEDFYEIENEERNIWINSINEKLNEREIDVKLYIGNEIYITENIIKLLEDEKASTINNTNYVLFELPLNSKPLNLYSFIYRLTSNNLVPIISHPERYSFLQKKPEAIEILIKNGVLMQCNFGSLIGTYGKKAEIITKKMLENNMVHFLGSDVHKQNTIYKKIPDIIKKIENLIGKEKLVEITEINPALVLKNKRISIPKPKPIELSFFDSIKTKF